MKSMIGLLLFGLCILMYSCLPNTGGKEPEIDNTISSINSGLSVATDTLPPLLKRAADSIRYEWNKDKPIVIDKIKKAKVYMP